MVSSFFLHMLIKNKHPISLKRLLIKMKFRKSRNPQQIKSRQQHQHNQEPAQDWPTVLNTTTIPTSKSFAPGAVLNSISEWCQPWWESTVKDSAKPIIEIPMPEWLNCWQMNPFHFNCQNASNTDPMAANRTWIWRPPKAKNPDPQSWFLITSGNHQNDARHRHLGICQLFDF